jgi:hypothetical protein
MFINIRGGVCMLTVLSEHHINLCLDLLVSLLRSVEQIINLLSQNQVLNSPLLTNHCWESLIQRQQALDRIFRNLDLFRSHTDLNLHNVNIARQQLLQVLQGSSQVQASASSLELPAPAPQTPNAAQQPSVQRPRRPKAWCHKKLE